MPSPASSEVWLATSFTICAPIFSNLSLSSTSFATDTPSFVTVGDPKDLSKTTFRPLGPRVTFTAFASTLTPSSINTRASSPNFTSLALMFYSFSFSFCAKSNLLARQKFRFRSKLRALPRLFLRCFPSTGRR